MKTKIPSEIYSDKVIKNLTVRSIFYFFMLVPGCLLVLYLHEEILCLLRCCTPIEDNSLSSQILTKLSCTENSTLLNEEKNNLFASALAIFLFTFPIVTFNWWLRNRDQLQQFEDTQRQYNESLLANALELLFEEDEIKKSVGLKQLITLRQNGVFVERIDLITSSGLKLEKTKLQRVDFQKVKFTGANLCNADLTEANLSDTKLTEVDLSSADLTKADLKRAKLNGADLRKAVLYSADLRDADLTKAQLGNIDATGEKNFYGDPSDGKQPNGADLRYVIYNKNTIFPVEVIAKDFDMKDENDLNGASYYKNTPFPIGFNPEDFDMQLKDDLEKSKD